jgi:hypothetical protein
MMSIIGRAFVTVQSGNMKNYKKKLTEAEIDILLDYFPEILYFLDQENTQEKENAKGEIIRGETWKA